jgi:hypothetical protein
MEQQTEKEFFNTIPPVTFESQKRYELLRAVEVWNTNDPDAGRAMATILVALLIRDFSITDYKKAYNDY